MTPVQSLLVSKAIISVLTRNADKFPKVNIILHQDDTGKYNKVFDEIIRDVSRRVPSKVINAPPFSAVNLDASSVLIFDTSETFNQSAKSLKWLSDPSFRFNHIVYAPNLTKNDVTINVKDGFDIDQVVFLLDEKEKSIDLVTSFMFTPGKCRVNQLRIINRFYRTLGAWDGNEFYPEKYKNFHNCELTSSVESYKHGGQLAVIAEVLNFKMKQKRKVDHHAEFLNDPDLPDSQAITFSSELVITYTYDVEFLWVVPDGEPVPQLEKMFLMFDQEV